MTWWAIDVRPEPSRREQVGAWLVARTGQAVEEREDGTLVTFAEDEHAAEALIAALASAEDGAAGDGAPSPGVGGLVDAMARGPRSASRSAGSPWCRPGSSRRTRVDQPVVVLDPETAFGSGEHGSTRAALALLERHLRPGDRVLDLGSGSGILAIAAVKLGAVSAVGIENDPEANPVAWRNAERNDVGGAVQFVEGDAGDLAPLLGPADVVLSNILRTVNTALLPAIVSAVRPGGGLAVFSGMERAEAPVFQPALAAAGLRVRDDVVDSGWWAVAAARV